ncbi:hypothetical protein [Paenibacillus roseipurpureus]|uniref:Uncharacterized protein n=1 Tax=Paenibacillus roseopurpureus TaxID=2918901 RepID=A0AA96RMF6_9BACL|nr:hypothetical protein [Paenibacillus sp. MBLB1832]WNR46384.1 hypothetical protein MJB10_09905 [Paenibacillus sp. MBLB1832]
MESLLVFLFKNWYLAIIAVAFFYRLQSRRAHSQSKNTTPGMPSFGGNPEVARRPSQRKPSPPPVQQTVRTDPKVSPFTEPKAKAVPADSPIYENDISKSSVFPAGPNREQLLQGIVWAEVLGPPRSKKPFRKR